MSKQHPPTLTVLFVFVSFILLSVHKPILLTAQDAPNTSPITDQITPVVDELTLAPPTETATETASTALTATASATETPSATASETPTLGPTEPATATSSATPLDTPTLGPTEPATFTPIWTETPFPTLTLPPMLTATATLPSPFGPEPPLQPLLTDTFDTGALYFWTLGAGWSLIASESGQALANTSGDEPVTFVHNTLTDLAVQVRVRFEEGMFRLSLRQSEAGAYTALLSADGQVALYRGTTALASAVVAPNQPGQWRTLRLSAIGDLLRVQVDGAEVIAVQDTAPLPQGTFSFAGVGASGIEGVVVYDVVVSIATQLAVTQVAVDDPKPTLPAILPTLLPTEQPFGATIQSMTASPNYDYAVVDNESGFIDAIAEANRRAANSITAPYRIYVLSRTTPYSFTSAIGIQPNANVRIYGMGSEITIFDSATVNNTLFVIQPGSSVEFYDLTLTGGAIGVGYPNSGYGGILFNQGNLKINGTMIRNNSSGVPSGSGGGAIFNLSSGVLDIKNTIFLSNSTLGGGGAIQNEGILTISCTIFGSNSASFGGAINNISGGTASVSQSKFSGNGSTQFGGGSIYNANVNQTPVVNAANNYWSTFAPNGPTVNPNTPSMDTISNGVQVSPALASDPTVPLSNTCKLPLGATTPPNVTVTDELSHYYGVTTNGWSATEQDNIRAGVRATALALAIQSRRAPIDAFNVVMRPHNSPQTLPLPVQIQFNKAGSNLFCQADPLVFPSTITCGISVSEYTVVHELGHIFSNRSDQNTSSDPTNETSLREYVIGTQQQASQLIDATGVVVMGYFIDGCTGSSVWDRGPRGWGSGPASIYNNCGAATARFLVNGVPPDFQQNAPPYNLAVSDPYDETAADMFLNWVYRIADPDFSQANRATGFRNINWSPLRPTPNTCNNVAGCPDTRNPGNARFGWMNNIMIGIFTPVEQNWVLP